MSEVYPWLKNNWQQINQIIESGRLPHAMIFTGEKHIGKKDFALSLTKKIIAEGNKNQQNLINENAHPDVFRLSLSEDSKIIKIADLRIFLEKTQLKPMIANKKIAIIDNAELMNTESANSFLKNLEEPAGNTIFILLNHRQKSIIPTIKSRCQNFIFNSASEQQILDWLKNENQEQILIALIMANNCPLLVREFLTVENQEKFNEVLQQILNLNINNLFTISNSWKDRCLEILSWWQSLTCELVKKSMDDSYQVYPVFEKFVKPINHNNLIKFYQKLTDAKKLLATSVNLRLVLEDLFILWCEIWRKN